MKRIVLCADDYGQAPNISAGIINLIKAKRLTAASCMVNAPDWAEHAANLRSLRDQVDIGLHFNLTHGRALSPAYAEKYGVDFQPISSVLRRAFLRQFDAKIIADELKKQLEMFEKTLGFAPNFIDGHQHIHHFPVIRDAIFSVYHERFLAKKTYLRLVNMPIKFSDFPENLKKIIIFLTGVLPFKRRLEQEKIPHNIDFTGIYSFARAENFKQLFPKFLQEINDHGLIMCHPGLASQDAKDPIFAARFHEYEYLMSDKFLVDCAAKDVVLTRFFVEK
ncbi:MAG: hypothetical protein ACD_46C00718G0005 [uncultured bacterium]|nr:MAG: hypothetical protein ACD_46C00718G0005 [uncultured bacterium]